MTYTFDNDIVSDLHKSAHGCRPTGTWWFQWKAMTDDEKQEEWDYLLAVAERETEEERQALIRWDSHITQLMVDNNIDRATAIRWDMNAMDANKDAGYYCYLWGVNSFVHEKEIEALLKK